VSTKVTAWGSSKTVVASRKPTPCLCRLRAALPGSHSNPGSSWSGAGTTPRSQVHPYSIDTDGLARRFGHRWLKATWSAPAPGAPPDSLPSGGRPYGRRKTAWVPIRRQITCAPSPCDAPYSKVARPSGAQVIS